MKREFIKQALLKKIESLDKNIIGIFTNGINITTLLPNGVRRIQLSDEGEKKVREFLLKIHKEEISRLEKELKELNDEDLCTNAQ